MASYRKEVDSFARSLRAAGLTVEVDGSGYYQITNGEHGKAIRMHRTPSDKRWKENMKARLKEAGLYDRQRARQAQAAVARERKAQNEQARARRAESLRPLLEAVHAEIKSFTKMGRLMSTWGETTGTNFHKHEGIKNPVAATSSIFGQWYRGNAVPSTAFLDAFEAWISYRTEPEPKVMDLREAVEPSIEPEPEPELEEELIEIVEEEIPQSEPLAEPEPEVKAEADLNLHQLASDRVALALQVSLVMDREVPADIRLTLLKKVAGIG